MPDDDFADMQTPAVGDPIDVGDEDGNVSPGVIERFDACRHCYAYTMTVRLDAGGFAVIGDGHDVSCPLS